MQLFALPMITADAASLANVTLTDQTTYAALSNRLAQAEQFVCGALQEGLWQVQAVGIVRARSQRRPVRELADRLQQRFTATNDALHALLRHFKTAFVLDDYHRDMLSTLRGTPPREFDLTYLGKTIRMHEVLLSLYVSASDNEQLSLPVHELAGRMLPLLATDLEDTMRLRALVARELATR
jgi:predicted outer membrane protein